MSKYAPLGDFLRSRTTSEVPMSFAEIERVIGAPLPPKAQNHPAWWSNSTSNNVMTQVWLDAGYKSERVDIASRRLVFRRAAASHRAAFKTPAKPSDGLGLLDRLRAKLGGTVTIAPGVDLTEPLWELPDDFK
jgi:hypothetical protein